ncbi:MAG: hypothetical protein V1709_05345 [Planctomycetota bacterium]
MLKSNKWRVTNTPHQRVLCGVGILVILVLGLWLGSVSYLKSQGKTTIDNITFGKLLMGDEVTKEDLQNCVVGVQFWGVENMTSRMVLTQFVDIYNKYKPNGFILLGFHSSGASKEDIIAFCKSTRISFPIYQGGEVSGLGDAPLTNPLFSDRVSRLILFDHKGNMIFDGHPIDAFPKLAAAMKAAPDPIIGEGPYKKLDKIAQKIKEHKEFGKILSTLKTKHITSTDADEKAEAEKLVECLTGYGNKLLKKADKKKDTEPLKAYNIYQNVATLFKGDNIGDDVDKTLNELKENKDFQDNLKADKELADIMPQIDKLKPCNKCKLFNKDCDACHKKNPSLEELIKKAQGLIKKYPPSPAANKVKELLPVE